MTINHTIPQNIRKLREQKFYSQEYLAAKLNIGQNAFSKMELGKSKITVDRFLIIAQVLEVSITELIGHVD